MSAKSSVPRSRETVLLVEDEDNVRALLRTLLGNEGYRVLEAPGGREALALCQQATGAIELLITDLNMPGMGGQQLAEAVYGQFPNVRVLYLSGYTDDAITRQGALQGRVTFLQKPFVTATLLRTVRDVLDAN